MPLRAAALRFPFGQPSVASVLVGARSPAEVEDNLRMYAYPIPDALWEELVSTGLLPRDVAVPTSGEEVPR